MTKLFLFIAMTFVGGTVFGQVASEPDKATLLIKDQTIPSFKFEISKGKVVSITDYKGKIVLINFFATWCGPCRRELPLVQEQIWNKHKDNPKFAMLTFGREHSWEEVLKFGKDLNFSFPLVPDLKRKVFGLFASEGIPRSFLIDETGKIIYLSQGFDEVHFTELKNLIDSKLN
ncbi:MAG: TlpA family protein disulfide reductase [Mariniphaga sp.]|nr:TlpA family protein disulfide reductase [Mariniphaga sp.]